VTKPFHGEQGFGQLGALDPPIVATSEPLFQSSTVFVAGALRSGTTMFRLLLDGHPVIRCPTEFDFLFDPLGPEGGLAAADRLDASAFDTWLEYNQIDLAVGSAKVTCASDRIRSIVKQARGSKPVLALPIHRNFLSAYELFPRAKFIHILRDPRDCARSSIGMGWAGNVYYGVDIWLVAERSWDRVVPRLSSRQIIEVRYEVLVRDPVSELTRICDFLGVTYSESMLDFTGTTYERPDASYAEQWKSKLSAGEVRLVEGRVGELLPERGYEPTIPGPVQLGRLELFCLAQQNRLARYAFAIRRLGLGLWLGDKLATRLGLRRLRALFRRRIHEINKAHWK